MDELKWICIMIIAVFIGLFVATSVDNYTSSQCKIAGIAAGMSAEEIKRLCR